MRTMFQFSDNVSTTTNIAIIDPQGFYGLGLRQVIHKLNGFEQSEIVVFKSGQEFFESPLSIFKILIIDAGLKENENLHFMDTVHKENKHISILMLADDKDEQAISKAIRANLSGFLCKDCSSEELHFALHMIQKGGRYYDTESMLQFSKSNPKKKLMLNVEDLGLDETDLQMLRLIADEYTQVEMNKILDLPTSTIMYLRRRLFNKLGVKNTAGFIRKAVQYGLIE